MTQSRIVPVTFDVTGPLPTGTTVLEASAGTGKTYAIVGLAARHVAAGVPLSELLLVTFSRFATAELRERTRLRFGDLVADLADPDLAAHSEDPLAAMLARGTATEVAARRRNLVAALSDFDAATIATTHTFCNRMLDGLGIAGDFENDITLVEDVGDLITEVTDDLYLQKYSGTDGVPFSVRDAHAFSRQAVFQRQARLAPATDPGSDEFLRVEFAEEVRELVERRKRLTNIRDYDDLQTLLRDTLTDPVHGEQACARVRNRFRVVLVDEFQDTDPVQWQIFKSAFHGHVDLVLVGDPKQSIYAFRGAEVFSYLEAVRAADNHQVLPTNWRSDAGLVEALDHVYGNSALGSPEIVVHHVEANTTQSRLPSVPPVRLRYLGRNGHGPKKGAGDFPALDRVRQSVAADVAADLSTLLRSGAALLDRAGHDRPIEAGDVAVLVKTHKQLGMIQSALDQVGIPSVLAGGESVYSTRGARDWLWLLQAMEQPNRSARVRLAALTPLLGWTASEVDAGGDELTADVSALLRRLVSLFHDSGFAAVYEQLSGTRDIAGRILSVVGGERILTDLTHVAQLCNRAVVEQGLGITPLVRWLAERISDAAAGQRGEQSRRLDTDAAAVQLLTVHRSKGLEFPVVYVPYGWDGGRSTKPATLILHEDGRRILNIGGSDAPGYEKHRRIADAENSGEDLRLLYVALTRAASHVVLWWAPSTFTKYSPLHRLLFSRDRSAPDLQPAVPDDATAVRVLTEWGVQAGDRVSVEPARFDQLEVPQWDNRPAPVGELDAARFARRIDHTWRRTSYSALVAGATHQAPVASEPEYSEKADEQTVEPLAEPVADGPGELMHPSLMNSLPFGAAFGTLVHEVLELVDTDVDDLSAEVRSRCADAVRIRMMDVDIDTLSTALLAVLNTPLGDGADISLSQISSSDRLSELNFELPLGSHTEATLQGIGDLMERLLPADDLLADYPEHLRRVPAPPLRGFLTGSVDAVLRLPGNSFVVVDYKTNRTARGDLSCLDYTPELMAREMIHSHYPLQALLYSVALHRYLRWRLADYVPKAHLGGVQYHFVRAMIGPQTPAGCGVFEWNPPVDLIVATSDLIAGRPVTT